MALQAKLYPETALPRRDARRKAELDGTMRTASSSPIDIAITDLSGTGFCASFPGRQQVGDRIRIGIAGIGVRVAHVIWREGAQHGCAFEQGIDAETVDRALNAGTNVVHAEFGEQPAAMAQAALMDDRYPGWVRLSLVLALPAAMWGCLIWAGSALLRS